MPGARVPAPVDYFSGFFAGHLDILPGFRCSGTEIPISSMIQMSSLLKISDAASLAFRTTVLLASMPEERVTASEAASRLKVSEAHLSKVLQRLVRHDLVDSMRGPSGGFRLMRNPKKIALLEVYEAIEGPFGGHDCLLPHKICTRKTCIMGELIRTVNGQIRDYLTKTKLADLVE